MNNFTEIVDEKALRQVALRLWNRLQSKTGGWVIVLSGELGAGKTTFIQGFLAAMGYHERVKSPTYTLVEPYDINGIRVYHFDLYRLQDPHELEMIGFRDYFNPQSLCLIEWPEKAGKLLPSVDIAISLTYEGKDRKLILTGTSHRGQDVIKAGI